MFAAMRKPAPIGAGISLRAWVFGDTLSLKKCSHFLVCVVSVNSKNFFYEM